MSLADILAAQRAARKAKEQQATDGGATVPSVAAPLAPAEKAHTPLQRSKSLSEIMAEKKAAQATPAQVKQEQTSAPLGQQAEPGPVSTPSPGPATSSKPAAQAAEAEAGVDFADLSDMTSPMDEEDEAPAISADGFTHPSQPDAYTPQQEERLVKALEIVRDSLPHKDMVGQAIVHTMQLLRDNKQLVGQLAHEDIALMVEALRVGYGNAVVVKETRTTKKAKNAELLGDVANLLSDVNFMAS